MLQGQLRSRKEGFIYKGMYRFSLVHFLLKQCRQRGLRSLLPIFLIMSDGPDLDFITYCYSASYCGFSVSVREKIRSAFPPNDQGASILPITFYFGDIIEKI
jgi:hypothetical protein